METVGKVVFVQGSLRRCLICDGLFTRDASREHFGETCFPKPPSYPPIPYGVTEGAA